MWGNLFTGLLNVSNSAVLFGAGILVQSTILLALGLCIAYALRKSGAAVQSVVLRFFLAAVLFCPAVTFLIHAAGMKGLTFRVPIISFKHTETIPFPLKIKKIPGVKISGTIGKNQMIRKKPESPGYGQIQHSSVNKINTSQLKKNSSGDVTEHTAVRTLHSDAVLKSAENTGNTLKQSRSMKDTGRHRVILYCMITVSWLSVSLFLMSKLLTANIYIHYMRYSAFDAKPSFRKTCKAIADKLGIKPPLVLQSHRVKSPVMAGFFKPFILLPLGEYETSLGGREVFLHELAHLKRHDFLWNQLRLLGIAIFPFQPLMWIISHWIEETADYVCDDYVMKYTKNHRSYAMNLIKFSNFYLSHSCEIAAGVGFLSFKSPMRRRIKRILDSPHRLSLNTSARSIMAVSTFCIVITFSAGFIDFKGISGVKTGSASETFSKTVVSDTTAGTSAMRNNTPQFTPVEVLTETLPVSLKTFTEAASHGAERTQSGASGFVEQPVVKPVNAPPPLEFASTSETGNPTIEPEPVTIEENRNSGILQEREAEIIFTPGNEEKSTLNVKIPEPDSEEIKTEQQETAVIGSQNPEAANTVTHDVHTMGFDIPVFSNNTIKMPAPRALNVTVNFDYENFNFDFSNSEDKRMYSLYHGLDKRKNEPAWSPDGKWIAFTDHSRIWIVPPQGGEPVLVYENIYKGFSTGNFESLCFTSDSREVTFKKDIYDIERGSIIEINGGRAVFSNPVPNIESVNIYSGKHRVIVEEGYRCAWSHSGRYLCYLNWDAGVSSEDIKTGRHGLPVIYDTETGNTWFLPVDENKRYGKPAFSPDDSFNVIPVRDGNGPIELFSIPLAGGEPEQLTFYEEIVGHGKYRNFPEYSPDGQWILYTDFTWSKYLPDKRLFVYHTVTGDIFEVFENAKSQNSFGKWSPDGKKICYLVEKEDGNYIYICDFISELYPVEKPVLIEAALPLSFGLSDNYPNPFNISTTIDISLPASGFVTLVIYNMTGQKVRELVSERLTPGVHTVMWDGCDDNGSQVSSGVYFSQLRMGKRAAKGRMTLVK